MPRMRNTSRNGEAEFFSFFFFSFTEAARTTADDIYTRHLYSRRSLRSVR